MITYLQFEKLPLKKGPWSSEEDQALIAYIKRYGIWNWNEMPKAAGLLRSGKSCRLRWMNYLRPNLKHGNFTKEEDEIILSLHQKLGNRWSAIATKLPGRTDNEIKNRWHSHLKKRYDNTVPVQQKTNKPTKIKGKKSAEKFVSDFPVLDSSSSKDDEIVFSPEFYQLLDHYLKDQETDSQVLIVDENSRNQSISPTALSSSSNSTIWSDNNWETKCSFVGT